MVPFFDVNCVAVHVDSRGPRETQHDHRCCQEALQEAGGAEVCVRERERECVCVRERKCSVFVYVSQDVVVCV